MSLAFSILPIALTMIVGYLTVAFKLIPKEHWGGIETLSFRLLIPVILITTIAPSTISLDTFGAFIGLLVLALILAGVLLIILRHTVPHASLPNPRFTSLFQTITRWSAFISLAAAQFFMGPQAVTLMAVAMAVLIPLINVGNILILSAYGENRATWQNVLRNILKNPLIQGSAIGLALNLTSTPLPQPILQSFELIGRSAFGIGLLVVGAGVSLKRLTQTSPLIWIGITARLIVLPLLFLALAKFFALNDLQTLTGVLILAAPAASNGYIVAKQMGGDADLYADILTWQTVLCLLTLPLWAIALSA